MGDVAIVAKVFVEDPSAFDSIKEEIGKLGKLADAKVEEIGFGAKVLKIVLVMPDKEGGDVEEKIKQISGVSQVQVEDVSLIS